MDLKVEFSKNLKKLRKRLELTQKELSDKTNLDVRYISRLETHPQNVSLDNLQRIAQGLGVAPFELLIGGTIIRRDSKEFVRDFDNIIEDLMILRNRVYGQSK